MVREKARQVRCTSPIRQSAHMKNAPMTGAKATLSRTARTGCIAQAPDLREIALHALALLESLGPRKGVNEPAGDSVKSPDGEQKGKGCADESSKQGGQLDGMRF